jgi:hypothetical protein
MVIAPVLDNGDSIAQNLVKFRPVFGVTVPERPVAKEEV